MKNRVTIRGGAADPSHYSTLLAVGIKFFLLTATLAIALADSRDRHLKRRLMSGEVLY